ncbi:MAG: GAF domain-containing protein [Anaerolinea sp.]|nr:GAF domain-containing protein [Anaerolinea sp.]
MKVNLSLGQRLGFGFLLLIILVIFTASLGLLFSRSITQTSATIQANTQLYRQATQILQTSSTITSIIDRMLLTRQTGGIIEEQLTNSLNQLDQELNDLTIEQSPLYQDNIRVIESFGAQLVTLVDEAVLNARNGRWAQAQVLRHTEISSLLRRFNEQIGFLATAYQTSVDEALSSQEKLQHTLRLAWIITTFLALGGGAPITFAIWRSTTTPINQLIAQTRQVMQRDFQPVPPLSRQDEIGRLSQAFAQMTEWLRESYQEMEERVMVRTAALSTSLEVSQSLTTILDPQQLIQEVVNQVQTGFNYYYVQIYLLDISSGDLVLTSGTGQAGQLLQQKGHRITQGRGLVGRAATTQEPVFIPNVTEDPAWLPNPLLPETQTETAVPILYGDTLLGVLDVQHNVVNGLSDEDVRLLQSVAGQVAIALRNARLYDQVQRQADQQTITNEIGRQIQTATTVETVLKIATRELTQALGTSRASIEIGRDAVVENGRTRGGGF